MKLKFNRMERIAGSFILVAFAGTVIAASVIFVRKGFFEEKVSFFTIVPSSESIYPGTSVQMAGVRIGTVEEVDLNEGGSARVEFSVKRRYMNRVHDDSKVSLSRASIIGEQVFDLSPGRPESPPAQAGQSISLQASKDPMSVLTGARVAQILENADRLIQETTDVMQQVSHGKNVQKIMGNLRGTTDVLNAKLPKLTEDLGTMSAHLAELSGELAQVSPEGHTRVAALLEETGILIQALQRNFFVRGAVSDVREEAAKKAEARKPASK